ncbi:3-deoxy-D-manno-octulosonic acid transferase [Membranihabitans marinus]|uniref:3-deoxy-D-manno-octulosonic acid transferase n=1 Tax=Membranihabitans marinus TaxID=1227546 RepID=UPI001F2AD2EB|nr:glycosyltransferase N-terminal domain-containing protein [Membranihabitans marinus]
MLFLYRVLMKILEVVLLNLGRFNNKLNLRNQGLKTQSVQELDRCIWIHAASLGEFEQGKPVLDLIKAKYPNIPLVLTFFSSSGYEKRKNYELADAVYYLPYDTGRAMTSFIEKIQPLAVIFIKYEFWFNALSILKQKQIDYYFISTVFRPNQYFFKSWGRPFLSLVAGAEKLFVQNRSSALLLAEKGIENVMVTGDTRIDRVLELVDQAFDHREIAAFTRGHFTVIAGSTWPGDEEVLLEAIDHFPDWKWILAPHEISPTAIQVLSKRLGSRMQLLSQIDVEEEFQVLIVDSVGLLSRIYRYGDLAYIGGGFGAGIHNTLEPLVYRLPVLFGPKYSKFPEAIAIVEGEMGRSITSAETLINGLTHFAREETLLGVKAKISEYIDENSGASKKILAEISKKIIN